MAIQPKPLRNLELSCFCIIIFYDIRSKYKMFQYESQIYKGDPRTCTIFIVAWGSNWGSDSSGFTRNQNNRGLSCCMSPASTISTEREDKQV